jgi:hypothetical protein
VKKILAALALTLSLLTGVNAEVTIPVGEQVANDPGGFCMWCSLEVVGRHQHVKSLFGLKAARKRLSPFGAASEDAVTGCLDALGVHYNLHHYGTRDYAALRTALDRNHAVVVGVQLRFGLHAVVLTELAPDHVHVIDSNHVGEALEIPRDVFDRAWDGTSVEILDDASR